MHILEDTFYQWVFTDVVASAQEEAHLTMCAACRAQLVALQQIAYELQIARASEPTEAGLTRYFQLFEEVEQAQSLVQQLGEFMLAQLQWDSRHQPAWQGVRNAQVASYRLLYATEQAEIELLIAPQDGQFQVEGEVIPLEELNSLERDMSAAGPDNAPILLPAKCEVHASPDGTPIATATCAANGRFHLGTLAAGCYQLSFVSDNASNAWIIPNLELR